MINDIEATRASQIENLKAEVTLLKETGGMTLEFWTKDVERQSIAIDIEKAKVKLKTLEIKALKLELEETRNQVIIMLEEHSARMNEANNG